jgi:hypothetical protein
MKLRTRANARAAARSQEKRIKMTSSLEARSLPAAGGLIPLTCFAINRFLDQL